MGKCLVAVFLLGAVVACGDPTTEARDPDADTEPDAPDADAGDTAVDVVPDTVDDATDALDDPEADLPPIPVGAWRDWSAQEAGPFQTGVQVNQLTYALPTGVERTIEVTIWYPSRATSGEPGKYLGGLVPDATVFLDAPVADPVHEGGFPLTIHSHGDRAYGGEITNRARHTTSHGWVVVAVDHTGNLLPDAEETPPAHWYHRPLDITAALDFVADLPADNPLRGRIVTERATLTGHSRGAYTVWALAGATYIDEGVREVCADACTDQEMELFAAGFRDPRLIAVSPQAGTLRGRFFGESGPVSVDVPILFMSGSEDDVGGEAQWERVVGLDFRWVEFEGGCHLSFTLGILCNTLSSEDGWDLTNTYSLAFARNTLLSDDSAEITGLLDGTVPLPKAVVRVKD